MYFKDGRAKVELGLAKGRKTHDKRQAIAERDAERDVRREMARRGPQPEPRYAWRGPWRPGRSLTPQHTHGADRFRR